MGNQTSHHYHGAPDSRQHLSSATTVIPPKEKGKIKKLGNVVRKFMTTPPAANVIRGNSFKKKKKDEDNTVQHHLTLLLFGCGGVGKTSLIKQLIIMFKAHDLNDEQRMRWISTIRTNCLKSMQQLLILTCGYTNLETGETHRGSSNGGDYALDELGVESSFLVEEKNMGAAREISQLSASMIANRIWTRELAAQLMSLWFDSHVQLAFRLYGHLLHYENTDYNFDTNLCEQMCNASFLPSNTDILMNTRKTVGLQEELFELSDELCVSCWDTGGQRNERRKWKSLIQNNEFVHAILFVVSAAEYDQMCYEDGKTNRLSESISMFREMLQNEQLKHVNTVVVFNKIDSLEKKMALRDTLSEHFPEYKGGQDAAQALQFIKQQFTSVISLPDCARKDGAQVSFIEANMIDRDHVKRLIHFVVNEQGSGARFHVPHISDDDRQNHRRLSQNDDTDSDPNNDIANEGSPNGGLLLPSSSQ